MAQAHCVTVLLYTDSAEPSGMGEHMLALGQGLRDMGGYCVLFACEPHSAGRSFLARASASGVEAVAVSGAEDLTALFMAKHVDILHLHAGIGWEGHSGVKSARAARVPVIVRTEHLPYLLTDPAQQRDYADLVRKVDRLICVSREARGTFVQAGTPADKISVIHNGIVPAVGVAERAELRSELCLPPHAILCLTVGRLTEQKGHRYLLEAIPGIVAQVPHAYFLWVGTGPLQDELEESAHRSGLYKAGGADRIYFLGSRRDVPRLIASCDLFVLPSLFEGLPLAILEAMSGGLPVVATNVLGSREAIEDGVSGRLIPPQESDALGAAIVEALTRHDMAESWAHNARHAMQTHFTTQRMVSETIKVYRDLLDVGN